MYRFEQLKAWQKSMDFTRNLYQATARFPDTEMFGLTAQLRRASLSIPLNVAEGSAAGSKRES